MVCSFKMQTPANIKEHIKNLTVITNHIFEHTYKKNSCTSCNSQLFKFDNEMP